MKKIVLSAELSDGSKVTIGITDFDWFIKCSPSDELHVTPDGEDNFIIVTKLDLFNFQIKEY